MPKRWVSTSPGAGPLVVLLVFFLLVAGGAGWLVGAASWWGVVWLGLLVIAGALWLGSAEHRGWALEVDDGALRLSRLGFGGSLVWTVPLGAIGSLEARGPTIIVFTPEGQRVLFWGPTAPKVVDEIRPMVAATPSAVEPVAAPRGQRPWAHLVGLFGLLLTGGGSMVPAVLEGALMIRLLRAEPVVVDLAEPQLPRGWVTVPGACVPLELFETFEVASQPSAKTGTRQESPSIDSFHYGILMTPLGGPVRAVVSLDTPEDVAGLACGGADPVLWVADARREPVRDDVARRLLSKKSILLEAAGATRGDDEVYVLEGSAVPAIWRLLGGVFMAVGLVTVALILAVGLLAIGRRRRASWALEPGHIK
jgi:hypothetical protein